MFLTRINKENSKIDWRIPSEWPVGAKPVSRTLEYDDLYRVKRVDYRHHGVLGGGADGWVDPHEADPAGPVDARRSKPPNTGTFTKRMQSEQFSYDWLGNRTFHDDDQHAFWDRSPGPISHGATTYGNTKRYRAHMAYRPGPTGGGALLTYDPAGNTTRVHIVRNGACAGGGTRCNEEVWELYYDEVGQLYEFEHFISGVGSDGILLYSYDQSGERVRKTRTDGTWQPHRDALYLFDSLELRGATTIDDDYELTPKTEVAYLNANGVRLARLHYEDDGGVAAIAGESLHVLLQVPDHLGSTSIVLHRNSSELVEAGSYTASGAAETDHRPGRWKHFREDYRFTGKEDDLEAGIQYFGKRVFPARAGPVADAGPVGGACARQRGPEPVCVCQRAAAAGDGSNGLEGVDGPPPANPEEARGRIDASTALVVGIWNTVDGVFAGFDYGVKQIENHEYEATVVGDMTISNVETSP